MIGIEVRDKRDKILQRLQQEKILAAPAAQNVIRFLPPYIIDRKQIDQTIETFERILRNLGE